MVTIFLQFPLIMSDCPFTWGTRFSPGANYCLSASKTPFQTHPSSGRDNQGYLDSSSMMPWTKAGEGWKFCLGLLATGEAC